LQQLNAIPVGLNNYYAFSGSWETRKGSFASLFLVFSRPVHAPL
jgi:hypothetical protein